MQLTVTGKQIDTGTVLRQHVEASLGAILGKYFKTAIEAHVVFSKEARLSRAEVAIHIGVESLLMPARRPPRSTRRLMLPPSGSPSRCAGTNVACGTTTRRRARPLRLVSVPGITC